MPAMEKQIQQLQQQQQQITQSQPPTVNVAAAHTVGPASLPRLNIENVIKPIELTENFYINNKRKSNVKIQVKLSLYGIYLRRETEEQNNINEQLICIEDIIGSRCGARLKKRARGGLSSCKRNHKEEEEETTTNNNNNTGINTIENLAQQQKDTSAYLYIYAYLKSEKLGSSRNRTVRILRFRSYEHYEDNLKAAERWYRAIRINKQIACGNIMATASAAAEQSKPLLILLNPKSGSGKGRELFQKQVTPILKEAETHFELQITTHANYARDLVKYHKDLLDSYSGIIVASGDGLFFEVLNGLMERNDWNLVCRKLPIGIIPCGSGNGLAASIAHLYNEPYEPKPIMHAALACVSGSSTPMDIVRVQLAKAGNNKPLEMYSFLSIGWGLIADIDIESERLRSIGAQRFTLWTIKRLISLRTYKGKLSYLPCQQPTVIATNEKQHTTLTTPPATAATTTTATTSQAILNEFHDVNEENFSALNDNEFFDDAISIDRNSFRPHVNSWHSATSRHTAYYSIDGQSIRSRHSVTANVLSKLELANSEFEQRLVQRSASSALPPLNASLPENWICIDGEFIMVHAAYTTHLAADCLFAPESRLNDGIIYLVIIRAGCGRSQLLQFMLGLSSGTHIPCPPNEFIQVIPVRAFRIEPYGDVDGIIAVDGERVDYGTIQAEILPGMINVMVPCVKQST